MRLLILLLALFAFLALAQDDAPADEAPAAPDAEDPPAADEPPAPDAPSADNPEIPTADTPDADTPLDTPGSDAPSVDSSNIETSTVNAPSNDILGEPTTQHSDAPNGGTSSTHERSSEAPAVDNNPIGTQYFAMLPNRTDTTVRGAVVVNTNSNGTGANVQVSISGLPDKGGPFMYHIHKFPISGLNCTSAGSHLDPYGATEVPACDSSQPDNCEVGDLSGKHGNMTGPSFSANYVDLYLSTQKDTPAFVGDLSIVVHSSNKTRLSCANFTLQGGALAPLETLTSTLDAGLPAPTQVLGNTSVINAPSTSIINAPAEPTPPTAGAPKNAGVGGMGLVGGMVALGVWAL